MVAKIFVFWAVLKFHSNYIWTLLCDIDQHVEIWLGHFKSHPYPYAGGVFKRNWQLIKIDPI